MPIARIGVILPLSGKYATFGEQALKGILLAAGIFETKGQEGKGARRQDNIQTANVEIIIKDTRDDPIASAKAVEYLTLNENVFHRTGKMFEKYNVADISLHAGGGEYPLQDGFGWTNGIASALLSNFGEEL